MRTKVKPLTHCCEDCLMKHKNRDKIVCFLADPHFAPKKLKELNDCPNWQN